MKTLVLSCAVLSLMLPHRGATQTASVSPASNAGGVFRLYGLENNLTAYLGFRSEELRGLGQLTLFQNGNPRISLGLNPSGESEFLLKDGSTRDKLALGTNGNSGYFWARGSSNNFTIRLDYLNTDRNKGRLQLFDNGDPRVDLYVNNNGDGTLEFRSTGGGRVRAAIGLVTTAGEFPAGQQRRAKAGYVATYSEEGNWVALLGPRSPEVYDHLGGGNLILRNRQGETTIQLNGQTGEIIGITKSFAIPHPANPEQQIVYAALEGPEAGAYVRGTASLVEGKAVVTLPEHFSLIVSTQGLTVHLTPRSTSSLGLAAVSSAPQEIVVGELGNGKGNYQFDYLVQGVRKEHANFRVIRNRKE